jgi:uncharacterized protein (DUF2147 family)
MDGKGVLLLLALLGLGGAAAAADPPVAGRWLSESGSGVIAIANCGAELCGKIVWLKEPIRDGGPAVDRRNPDPALRTRPICGLPMLGGFHESDPGRWTDGWIYSPENGKTYRATLSLGADGKLKLRGYVGIPLFGETQIWTRADPGLKAC